MSKQVIYTVRRTRNGAALLTFDMKYKSWLFDVDGTLTPSRKAMPAEFRAWFLRFARNNEVHLVTGSDYPKTLEQVGPDILPAVRTVFNCMGNSVWREGIEVRRQDFILSSSAEAFLLNWLYVRSSYPVRCGQHIEVRPGMVNFSVVGRGAGLDERDHYFKWDQENGERIAVAKEFEERFPDMSCQIAGETGVDIFWKGCDKSQVLRDPMVTGSSAFFGDRIHPGGNDYSLAVAVAANGGAAHPVTSWEDTWAQLLNYQRAGELLLPAP